jgi:hypothetical protein
MKIETTYQKWSISENGKQWTISFSEERKEGEKFHLTDNEYCVEFMSFRSMQDCLRHIEQSSKPPFVELTLADFVKGPISDTGVSFQCSEGGYRFVFVFEDKSFRRFGAFYNSAAEVIAALNERRRKEYYAGTNVIQ